MTRVLHQNAGDAPDIAPLPRDRRDGPTATGEVTLRPLRGRRYWDLEPRVAFRDPGLIAGIPAG